ncbi:MAG: DUF4336 domain-containing protein [Polyangiaceae bacterium]
MLEQFGPSLYVADGPEVSFFGFPYPTRMVVAKLADGGLWVWSPVDLTPVLESAVNELGPVRHLVSPNKIHHIFLKQWSERYPDAKLYAPPGLARRKPELRFDAELGDEPDSGWDRDVDQVVFRGSFAVDEVVFFHRPSKTAIIGDLVQRFEASKANGWKGAFLRLNALVGEEGSTPREWRATFLNRAPARAARSRLLAWQPDRMIIAHGMCVSNGATPILERAFAWI